MEVRVQCPCEQAYTFEIEPVDGAMPCVVNCPSCGADGTALANRLIQQNLAMASPAVVAGVAAPAVALQPEPAAPGRLRINRSAPVPASQEPAVATAASVPPALAARPKFAATAGARAANDPPVNNMGMGILGAFLGAALGAGLMYGFFLATDLKFPWFGVGIGALTGFGARLLYKGTDSTLGGIAAAISLGTVVGTLYLMFGELSIIHLISMILSVSMAFKIAA